MDKRSLFFLISVTTAFLLINSWYEHARNTEATPLAKENVTQLPEPTKPHIPSNDHNEAQPKPQNAEQYFILENQYQQLVFSSTGGSIIEINLPFKNTNHPNSVVLPIAIDKELPRIAPRASLFPLVKAQTAHGSWHPQIEGGYYPLIRRIDEEGNSEDLSQYATGALSSKFPELSSLPFTVTSFTEREITFEAQQPHRRIVKKFSLPIDENRYPYCFDIEVFIEGDRKDLWIGTGVPDAEWMAGAHGAALKYRIIRGTRGTVERVDLPKKSFRNALQPDWVCNSNGFFGIILDPLQGDGNGMLFDKVDGNLLPSRLRFLENSKKTAEDFPGYIAKLQLSQTNTPMKLRVFAGPFSDEILTRIDANSIQDQQKPTNYLACQTFHGWFSFISEPFAKFLFFIMKQLHKLFGSWALCIILATVVLRILMYPLNRWSFRSMRAMQEIAPQIKQIQEQNKKDPMKAQKEIMALYREKGVNPLSGCLPLLIQMPFLIGMFDLLRSTFELRGAVFIPGWINDLSAPDVAYTWGHHIFLLGTQLHLLPIILGGIMWLQQRISSPLPKDPREWTDQQRQQRAMGSIMAVVMTIMFYQFPSGLNLYWISSMLLSILQQWWTNRATRSKE